MLIFTNIDLFSCFINLNGYNDYNSYFRQMKKFINECWREVLNEELDKPYIHNLNNFLSLERAKHTVFPDNSMLFSALNTTSFKAIKVVILGQDPYHQLGQANGLAFSVSKGTGVPPSLRNIYKELEDDIHNFIIPTHGDLSSWAKQGVLLLNTTLSVRENQAGSHQKHGWEELTNSIIQKISEKKNNVVFILWGKSAQSKSEVIDQDKHFIISSAHPSPLSVYRGFWGSKPFSKTNNYLIKHGKKPIDWRIA